jgi:effector-binding domain-containing protein
MLPRFALCLGLAIVVLAAPRISLAQTPAQTPPAAPTTPDAPPPAATQQIDPFGEDATLTAKPIAYVKGTGTWDKAFETIINSFKTIKTYISKEGLKTDGQPMTIFTSTDDNGFVFQAAIPIAEPPKNPPHGEVSIGTSPEGHALKFVHRGSYNGLDNTYEAITNYLDERRLEARDMFIEQYLTDPLTTNEDHLVVDVYVLVK